MTEAAKILDRIDQLERLILERLQAPPKPAMPPKLWTPEELAEALRRKPYTVREWCRLGRIRATKPQYGRHWQITDDEAQRLISGGSPDPEWTHQPSPQQRLGLAG